MGLREDALSYHRKGKIGLEIRTKLESRADLTLAYTPGVAEVSREIARNKEAVYDYTWKWNSVAIISDGTRVLGLGDVGPEAALPVMEGKAMLLKRFGGVDAIPLCIGTKNEEEIIAFAKAVSPTFGGILLEDIESPKCFDVETKLKRMLDIPVFHDDQHGTAIVALAGLINALKIAEKKKNHVKVVVNGAGAAGIAIAKLLIEYGVKDITVLDSKGAICNARDDLEQYKREFSLVLPHMVCGRLENVINGADVFIGASAAGALRRDWTLNMAEGAIVFALSNPVPEITLEQARAGGAAVYGSGRSDAPNQINNVLAFPGVFRGALDVRARAIDEGMKLAAAGAIAGCVGEKEIAGGKIVPDPLDPLVAKRVAEAVSKKARENGLARI
jgi:malate dehydrogenase (oxaloacetate-decarboxylating)